MSEHLKCTDPACVAREKAMLETIATQKTMIALLEQRVKLAAATGKAKVETEDAAPVMPVMGGGIRGDFV